MTRSTLLNALLPAWNASLILLLAKATIILLAALGITFVMQRASAGARHLVWLVALGTLLLVPALTAWAPLRVHILPAELSARLAQPSRAAAKSDRFAQLDAEKVRKSDLLRDTPVTEVPDAVEVAPVTRVGAAMNTLRSMSGPSTLLAVWGAVAVALLISLAWSAFAVRRIVAAATLLDTDDWRTPLYEIADRLGLDEPPRLLRSTHARIPFACGMLTPTIVLPADCDGWSGDRRRAVLIHELAHVRRHDLFGHTLGRLVCAVYWFHPLVWTASKNLRSESERACDDLALSCGTRATDYAEHLLDIVTSVRGDCTPSVALAMARRKEFEGRMLAILDPELRRAAPSRLQSAAMIASLALLSVTVGAASPVARVASAMTVASDTTTSKRADSTKHADDEHLLERVHERDSDSTDAFEMRYSSDDSEGATMHAAPPRSVNAVAEAQAVAEVGMPVVRMRMEQSTNQVMSQSLSTIVSGATRFGTATADAVLKAIATAGQEGQRSDDRPMLLAKVLQSDTSASLRRIAAWGLHEYADKSVASDALTQAVRRDASAEVREMAAWSLGNGDEGRSAVVQALAGALRSDNDQRVRLTSAWALGNIGDKDAVDALAAAAGDANRDVRVRAIWAIGNVQPHQAPRAVINALGDQDARIRHVAAWALYQIEDAAAVSALESALKTETVKDNQLADIRALAAMGEKSVDAIKSLLDSQDPRIKQMAVRALAGGHASGPWPWPWPEPRPYP